MVEEKFEELKTHYFEWLQEQERSSDYFKWKENTEEFFANELYGCLVDLQRRKYLATNEQLGQFVRMTNDFIQEQLTNNFYYIEFARISALQETRRTIELSKLMDVMRAEYKIPLLNDEEFNKNNVEVMQLYRDISNARDL